MKKLIFLLFLFPLVCLGATRTISDAGGNWTDVGTWDEGVVPTSADDVVAQGDGSSGNVTINATNCAAETMILTNYTGTMTFTAGQLLQVDKTVTFVAGMTIAGTGTLEFNDTGSTITSGGITFTGSLDFDGGTWTLADNWDVDGNVVFDGAVILNGSTINVAGGLLNADSTSELSGTTNFILDGTGTLQTSDLSISYPITNNLTINTAGTITIGEKLYYQTGTFTYTAGTVDASTNSSSFGIDDCTLNTNGITWYDVSTENGTITLGSNLTIANKLDLSFYNTAFSGAYNVGCATLDIGTGGDLTFPAGQTLTISTNLYIEGSYGISTTIKSGTASTAFNLNFAGAAANCQVYEATFTDTDASGSAQGIDNWYGGTLTRTTNITNRTSADIGAAGGGGTWGFAN